MDDMQRIELEFTVNTSPKILYYRLHNPSGLEEWYADKVLVSNGVYIFKWQDYEEEAELIDKKINQFVKFKRNNESYFELSINTSDITGEVSLNIIDLVEEGEEDEMTELWTEQVTQLKRALGV